MGDSFSDIYSEELCRVLIHHKRVAELLCRNYILLPQTYGPFKNKKLEKKAGTVIKKARCVFSRDSLSTKLVKNLSNRQDVIQTPDMAFVLPYRKEYYQIEKTERINIGVNVSGLLWRGGFDKENQFGLNFNYKKYVFQILEWLLSEKKYSVHLIPHVIDMSPDSYDDDYKVLCELKEKYGNVVLAPPFETPIEAKSYISRMDCFIGARMHSTIAAFSSGVATIPFSYSRKFEGLFGTLKYNYVIHG